MVCYHPLKGYFSPDNGRFVFGFVPDPRLPPGQVTCGRCQGCRQKYARDWAIRCMHEAKFHRHNSFITLTYNKESLPNPPSLVTKHFQDFMKRLRINYSRGVEFLVYGDIHRVVIPSGIRVYYCGEYGPRGTRRPHWHAVLFGVEFFDKKLHARKKSGDIYRSKVLQSFWPHGFVTCGDLTFNSAGYCARYAMKKVNGEAAKKHYQWICPRSGHVYDLKPEHAHMSRRGGIGLNWIAQHYDDVYPSDEILLNGKSVKPPKFYDNFMKKYYPEILEPVKVARRENVKIYTHEELMAMKEHHKQRLNRLKRGYELGDSNSDDLVVSDNLDVWSAFSP